LGDRSLVQEQEQPLLDKLSGKTLHPVQCEEVCARFVYWNYLLRKQPEYLLETESGKRIIKSIATENQPAKTWIDPWNDELFSQLLAEYWKPWGLEKKDIIRFAEAPISYLYNDYTNEIIEPESIGLPF